MSANNKNFWKEHLAEWTELDLVDRLSEVLFGLIMVLSVTCTISISTSGQQDIDHLLYAAISCNAAWGLVDGIMYILSTLIDRNHGLKAIREIIQTKDLVKARGILRNTISPIFSGMMDDAEIDDINRKIKNVPEPSIKSSMTTKDLVIAVEIFMLVFLSTFPVTFPFIMFNDAQQAMRISNGIALLMLFTGSYVLARYAGFKPFITAIVFTGIGILLVIITIALGG